MSFSAAVKDAASLLRSWGVEVAVHPDAASNGRPLEFAPIGVVAHHTASAVGSSETASRNVVLKGRTSIPGPLAQIFVARDSSVYFCTYGRANHAGLGGPWRTVPKDSGNRYLVGVEVDNNGLGEPYPPKQLLTARLVYAALLISLKRDHTWLIGHKEWAPGRKPDPLLDMGNERAAVAALIREKTAPPPSANGSYRVVTGDTLWAIGQKFGVDPADLRRWNSLPSDEIFPGQVLRISATNTSRTYVVQAEDTLYSIGRKFGVDPGELQRLNGITDEKALQVGRVLRLPA